MIRHRSAGRRKDSIRLRVDVAMGKRSRAMLRATPWAQGQARDERWWRERERRMDQEWFAKMESAEVRTQGVALAPIDMSYNPWAPMVRAMNDASTALVRDVHPAIQTIGRMIKDMDDRIEREAERRRQIRAVHSEVDRLIWSMRSGMVIETVWEDGSLPLTVDGYAVGMGWGAVVRPLSKTLPWAVKRLCELGYYPEYAARTWRSTDTERGIKATAMTGREYGWREDLGTYGRIDHLPRKRVIVIEGGARSGMTRRVLA